MDEIRVYVGNLPFRTTDQELKKLFEEFGTILNADVIRYKQSGRSKGYAFVTMEKAGGEAAIVKLNDFEFQGRTIKVREAKARANFPKTHEEKQNQPESIRIGTD